MATIAARPPRRLGAPLVLVIPALLFGLIVTVQWRTQAERSELTVRYNAPLLDAANSLQNEQNSLKAQLADLRAQLEQIQQGAASQSTVSRVLSGAPSNVPVAPETRDRILKIVAELGYTPNSVARALRSARTGQR